MSADSAAGADTPPPISDTALREWLRHLTESQAGLVAELHRLGREQPAAIRAAVADGVAAALTDKQVVGTALGIVVDVAQERAAQQTGKWLLGWFAKAAKTGAVVVVVGYLVIKLAGFDAAVAVGKWITGTAGKP